MSQSSGQTRERRLILRQAEAQNTFVPIEPAAPDVLHGKLFVDYLSPLKREMVKKKLAKARREAAAEAAEKATSNTASA